MRHKIEHCYPDFIDPKKQPEILKKLSAYAKSMGYTDDEIKNIRDRRHILMVHKAHDHDMAHGGNVKGPGTATSDSIPARLSDGEYVLNAKAVQTINKLLGPDFLDKLNRMGK